MTGEQVHFDSCGIIETAYQTNKTQTGSVNAEKTLKDGQSIDGLVSE
jgi:hypothetical protein